MAQTIAIWGNPGSGKSTLSLKLAKKINEELEKDVIVLFCEDKGSPLVYGFPKEDIGENSSLGKLLTSPEFTQDDILRAMITPKGEKKVFLLGYGNGESQKNYSELNDEQVIDFYVMLKQLDSIVLIDCASEYENNLLSQQGLKVADKILQVNSGDPKCLAYMRSTLKTMDEVIYRKKEHFKVLNDVYQFPAIKEVGEQLFGEIDVMIPFEYEIVLQNFEGNLLEKLKKGKGYDAQIKELFQMLFEIATEDKKIKKKRKRKRGEQVEGG